MLAMMFCTLVQGANRTVTENDGQGNKKRVIELRDTVINGETVTDTLSIMTYETVPAVAMLRKMENPPQQYGLERVRPREQDLGDRDCRNSHRLCIRTAATHHIRSILLPL